MAEATDSSVRVRFVTRVDKYRVPPTAFAVPTSLTRYGLSEVVNHLLALGVGLWRACAGRPVTAHPPACPGAAPSVPFDFLINNEFVRSSIGAFLRKRGISLEGEVEVEFLPILPQPAPHQQEKQPDWIASVSCSSG